MTLNKTNGYTTLKLLCAMQVFYGHLIAHFNLSPFTVEGIPIISDLLSPFHGVPIFFGLSGYFIWKSLSKKNTTAREYAIKRFVRIFPELWIVVAVSAIAIMIFAFKEIVWPSFIAWIFTQSTVMQFWTPDCLRGYGVGCPNGSLWTITVFVQFYIVVYLLHKVLHKKHVLKWGGGTAILHFE